MKKNLRSKQLLAPIFVLLLVATGTAWSQTSNYFNGFETSVGPDDWADVTRVTSGTNGIISATGAWHAEVPANAGGGFTRFGHVGGGSYNSTFPTCGYKTSLDVYLDVNGGWTNDTRFDYSSAINGTNGLHRRDFAFNVGFYNDAVPPGTGNRFVISASNNTGRSNSFPKNPGRSPQVIATTGWYTFEHSFRNNAGVLAVDLTIYDASQIPVATWTLSDPSDLIGITVGGSRYGWLLNNEFNPLAIDNSSLTINPQYTYYFDGDNDGYGDPNNTTISCSNVPPSGYVANNTDNCPLVANADQADADNDGAGDVCDVTCGNKNDKVRMCHNGHEICISANAVQAHLNHGDNFGPCTSTANRGNPVFTNAAKEFKLSSYPNPFEGRSTIKYELPFDSKVSIKVYDITGRVVATLVDAERKAGIHTVAFNAGGVGKGFLYYKIVAQSKDKRFEQTNKMMNIR